MFLYFLNDIIKNIKKCEKFVKKKSVFSVVKMLFFLYDLIRKYQRRKYMNISELIKNDTILSQYKFEEVYTVIIRLFELGYISIDFLE